MEFEARFHRFVAVGDVSILNGRVFSFFRLKHVIYLFLAIVFVWRGLSGSGTLLAMGLVIALLAVLSALFSRGSMSLEAKIVTAIISLFGVGGRRR